VDLVAADAVARAEVGDLVLDPTLERFEPGELAVTIGKGAEELAHEGAVRPSPRCAPLGDCDTHGVTNSSVAARSTLEGGGCAAAWLRGGGGGPEAELRNLTEAGAARIADELFQLIPLLDEEPDRGSGLVEQQRLFSRARR
jgi:hypothetical protein